MSALFSATQLSPYLRPFITLSYPTTQPKNPDSFYNSTYYTTGWQDVCLIITCIAVMAILRDALRLGFFEPLANWKLHRDLRLRKLRAADTKINSNGYRNEHANGNGHTITDSTRPTPKELRQVHRSVLRFAEQGWSFVYYTIQCSYGLYIHRNLPTRILDPTDLWRGYPHIPLAGPLKFYYLSQTAFYLHQILILNAEARRKDHAQMMTHHVITVFLMGASYFYNSTRIGCLIMVLMDWCDIFLPLAKMIRYFDISQFACDLTFGWFLISWFVTRHVLFIFVIISTFRDAPSLISFKWSPEEGHYLTNTMFRVLTMMLVALQVIQILWFGMICRVAWRVLTTDKGAADVRSDEEDENDKES